jgi:hypothetical protein
MLNLNTIHEGIMNRLGLWNDYCHAVQNFLSFCLLSESIIIKIYKTIILPVVLYRCETWYVTLRGEHGLRVFENGKLRRILN